MLRGVNRQVVEVAEPDSAYFEKVLFFVKPEYSLLAEEKLKMKADALIKDASYPPIRKNVKKRRLRLYRILQLFLAAAAGAAAMVAAYFLFG